MDRLTLTRDVDRRSPRGGMEVETAESDALEVSFDGKIKT